MHAVGVDTAATGLAPASRVTEIMTRYRRDMDQVAFLQAQALAARDEGLRQVLESGWRPVDLRRATGLSSSTIELVRDPRKRTKRRTEKSAAREAARPPRPLLDRGEDDPAHATKATGDAKAEGLQ